MADENQNKDLVKVNPSKKKPESDEEDELGGSMTFLEHLEELRERLIRVIVAFAIATVICFYFSDQLLSLLFWPLPSYMKEDYVQQLEQINKKQNPSPVIQPQDPGTIASSTSAINPATPSASSMEKSEEVESVRKPSPHGNLVALGPFEGMLVYMKISLIAGIFLSFPFIFYEAWMFIAPGLYRREKRMALPLILSAWICFIIGGIFCYCIIWGFILGYLAEYFTPSMVEIQWSLNTYVSTTTNFILAFGLIFEEPVIFALLAMIGVVKSEWLSKFRAYAIVIIFTIAAVITPPDPFSQTICAIPLWILYEISIVVVRTIERGKRERNGEEYAG